MSRKRILLVDDDPALLEALPVALQLRMEDLDVDTADSAAAALEQIAQVDYDAVVTDIKMPGMDGLTLLAKVKEVRPDTPTLLITGHSEDDLAIRALRGGAYDYIPKPIDRDYFIAALQRAIQAVHLTRQVQEQRQALERHAALLEETVQARTRKLMEADQAKDALLGQVEALADQLRQRADELDTIIESMADGIYVCDANGQIARINAGGAALLGLTRQEAQQQLTTQKGFGPYRSLDGSPLPEEEVPLAQALRGVSRTGYRLMIRRYDTGEDRQVRVSAAPIRNHAGQITGAVAVASDITQLYLLERQKDEFIGIASHELKTPLTALKTLTQLTLRQLEQITSPTATRLRKMERAITRMEQLIEEMLDVSRIEAGKLTMHPERCDLRELCQQVVEESMIMTERAITLQMPEEPVNVEVDRDRMSQVLANLLSNALKYSPSDSHVVLTLTPTQESVILSVRDAGPGIPDEALFSIFTRFYRVPGIEIQSGSGVGLGLGLYICREIVERHGGRIWAESLLGSGSTFYVELPRPGFPRLPSSSRDRTTSIDPVRAHPHLKESLSADDDG